MNETSDGLAKGTAQLRDKRGLRTVTLALAALLMAPVGARGQTYTLTDLGDLGGSYSYAYGLNNFGQVVGSAQNNQKYQVTIQECDPHCNPENGHNCCRYHNEQRDNRGRPFLWTPRARNGTRGSMIDLGFPADSALYGVATKISESGWVIGGDGDIGGFCWAPMLPNSSTGSLTTNCIPYPITVSDQVLNLLGLYPGYSGASRLGTLPGYSNSIPLSANTNGQVVGCSFNRLTNGFYQARAFLFTFNELSPSGTVTSRIDLGALPGFTNTVATSINNHGQVVGFSSADPFLACGNPFCIPQSYLETFIRDSGAFIWDSARGLRKLTPLIQGAPSVDFVDFFEVRSINDAGQIAGTAWIPTPTGQVPNGRTLHAVLLTPQPTPTLALAAMQPNGQFRFTLTGEAGSSYTIQASTNLVNWIAVTNFLSATGTNRFTDPAAPNLNRRFYRAVTP